MGNSILFPFTSLTCMKEWPLELNWILYFLCTGNFICFSIVYYPSDPSLPVAKLTNAGLVSFWPFDFFFFLSIPWTSDFIYEFAGFAWWHAWLPRCSCSLHSEWFFILLSLSSFLMSKKYGNWNEYVDL